MTKAQSTPVAGRPDGPEAAAYPGTTFGTRVVSVRDLVEAFGQSLGSVFFIGQPWLGLLLWGALLSRPALALFALCGLLSGVLVRGILRVQDAPGLGGGVKANALLTAVVTGWMIGPMGMPWAQQLVLPWITLCTIYVALIARVTRASVSEALTEDYIRTARAKGLPEAAVLMRHALANAAVPIATVIGIGIALLIGGVVVTETVFAIPGLGRLTVDAILRRDYPIIQGVTLLFSAVYVLVNLLVDLSYSLFDPRIRY